MGNILVACEESQAVCKAFREKGHEAYSCDIQPCSGGHPEWHIMGDALQLVNGRCSFKTMDGAWHEISGKWDLIIAHPPCTYLSNAGARWLYAGGKLNQERYLKGLAAKDFFMKFYTADCNLLCIENPIPSKIYDLPLHSQIIQPYEFGEPYSKATLLWLKGLPPLFPTELRYDYLPYISSGSYSKYREKKYAGVTRDSKTRSKTFKGIALAMAAQWGDLLHG